MMKKKLIFAAVMGLIVCLTPSAAFAGTWTQDSQKPESADGITNWQWINDDGSVQKNGWAWIDGNGDGIAECYYFNSDGYMLGGTTVNDAQGSWTVNSGGAWTENGSVRIYPDQWVPGGNVLTGAMHSTISSEDINPINTGYTYETATHSTLTDDEAYAKLMEIKELIPEGTHWGAEKQYISGRRYGYACAAFVFLLQDRLYGTEDSPAKPRTVYRLNMSDIRTGDHIRIQNNTHSVIVLQNNGDSITVAEGAYKNTVHWGRVISADELKKEFVYLETCY